MAYRPPNTRVTSIANSRTINISEEDRIPAIVGAGPSLRYVTDYAVTRGVGSGSSFPDYLANYNITITRVAPYQGATGSYSLWDTGGVHNWQYNPGVSDSNLGFLFWESGSAGNGQPLSSETYYVSYYYPVPSTQFEPQTFVDSADIEAVYGNEVSGSQITTAAKIALENGAPAVICLQVSGSTPSGTASDWSSAFDKLKKKDAIAYLVPISTDPNVQNVALTHCILESDPLAGHEREVILGLPDNSSVDLHINKATALFSSRAILVVPGDDVTRRAPDGTVLQLNGTYVAAAVAGLQTAQEKPITPITGKTLVGFIIPDDQYLPYDMNRMGNAGVCVIYSKSGVIKIRHAITTDTTSADTNEISVVAADDLVRRITRTRLNNAFIGKGIVISPSTPSDVANAVQAIWNQLVRTGLIYAYGIKNDPTTGEVPITAQQDPNSPTKINVTGSIKFLYPLNYIDVSFYIYI